MSEHEQDERDDFTEADTPDEQDGDDTQGDEQADQTSAQAAGDDGSDELIKKAEKAQTNYYKRIREIFGDRAPKFECPACDGLGLTWNDPAATAELVAAPDAVACEDCNALGIQRLPSKVSGHETRTCLRCAGRGWHEVVNVPQNVTPIAPTVYGGNNPVMGTMAADGTFTPLVSPNPATGQAGV